MLNKSTDDLDIEIKNTENIKSFLEENKAQFSKNAFCSYLRSLIDEKNLSVKDVAKESGLTRGYVNELAGVSKKSPSRNTVIKLALALALDITQTNRLLKLAGCGELYPKRKRDSIIIYCVNTSKPVYDCDELLFDEGLKTLSDK